jgi:hypothetical protein
MVEVLLSGVDRASKPILLQGLWGQPLFIFRHLQIGRTRVEETCECKTKGSRGVDWQPLPTLALIAVRRSTNISAVLHSCTVSHEPAWRTEAMSP